MDEILDDNEMVSQKQLIHKKVEVLHRIKSRNILRCYEVYEDESYIAAIYEYIPNQYEKENQSLANELADGKVRKKDC
jgi:hypothetical protein